ncbi:DUF421 domain-containing protein [Peribacillus butanolivorans]|uniref:DUF421 domain-containing protein n=1 Tax=Peribacillus butanolivorans TaxID=421767 RepID=UPI002E24F201|nr:DUF421 domain-containing protein [Peribacillus butanolivorans]
MEDLMQPIIRTGISYIVLLVFTYLFGKRMNSQLNYYSFALSVTVGSYIANMGFDTNLKFFPTLASFLTLIFIFFLSSIFSFKQRGVRKYLSGQPIIIIEKGEINEFNMRKAKYSIDDLKQQIREQGVFKIDQIETAILEVSGKLSIEKKEEYQPLLKKDKDLLSSEIPIELIFNGVIITKNLTSVYNKEWVMKQCKDRKITAKDVRYGVVGRNGVFYVMN